MTFAVNYLAPFLLTLRLLDLVEKAAPSKIINVSSMAHIIAIDFNPDYAVGGYYIIRVKHKVAEGRLGKRGVLCVRVQRP